MLDFVYLIWNLLLVRVELFSVLYTRTLIANETMRRLETTQSLDS